MLIFSMLNLVSTEFLLMFSSTLTFSFFLFLKSKRVSKNKIDFFEKLNLFSLPIFKIYSLF
jgi:hypothetical protein